MKQYFDTGVRLALSASGLKKLAEVPADILANALKSLGNAAPPVPPSLSADTRDPKDPDPTQTRSGYGPFSGDTLTSLGLNTNTTDFLSY